MFILECMGIAVKAGLGTIFLGSAVILFCLVIGGIAVGVQKLKEKANGSR